MQTVTHDSAVESSSEILDRLKRKGVTQQQIADVLGVAQPNVSTLYAQGKNGKPRQLKWDEGVKLIEEFGLGEADREEVGVSEELLEPMVEEILDMAKRPGGSEVRLLASALARYLRQITRSPAIRENRDALKAVAQAVSPLVQ